MSVGLSVTMSVERGRGKRACGPAFRGFPEAPFERLGRATRFRFAGRVSFAVPDKSPDRKPSPGRRPRRCRASGTPAEGCAGATTPTSGRWPSPHVDPATGETARTFRTVGAKTKKGAEKAHDALIFGLRSDGGAVGSSMTVREFMEQFLHHKEASGTIEPSTMRSYRSELPGARERLDDARHLRRRGPTRSYSCLLFPQGKSSAPPQPARSPRAMTEPLSTLPCGGHSTGRDRFYWCHASRGPPCRRAI